MNIYCVYCMYVSMHMHSKRHAFWRRFALTPQQQPHFTLHHLGKVLLQWLYYCTSYTGSAAMDWMLSGWILHLWGTECTATTRTLTAATLLSSRGTRGKFCAWVCWNACHWARFPDMSICIMLVSVVKPAVCGGWFTFTNMTVKRSRQAYKCDRWANWSIGLCLLSDTVVFSWIRL